ncbi:N-acetyltransferase [Enterococcus sp. 669A]|uniref:N-acetyltransferase n=1 Tax=Candidatus Enterococcus moelleringii TaxID=2815325 RepID=A0ABS3LEB0_9ENTE|nr:N-acetyltransferase [Enterococcus sp. 669A]MBO1307971.1 N-acetyltransferase [Enterococcus sp. 669A]
MIKELTNPTQQEIEKIAQLWLASNLEAHDFVAADYWRGNYSEVKEMLPNAQLFVYSDEGELAGFMGLMEGYIAGIFVKKEYQQQGIGRALLAEAMSRNEKLTLAVYKQNQQAYRFYVKQGFTVEAERIDPQTDEVEYQMSWTRNA